ncbi:hypothetical protein O1L60_30925 [Streptomyces diastatochromogenes]|nr:hypothetical protein [Streptomyces diastatochromogenes]
MKTSTAILVAATAVATVTTLSAERRHRETIRLAKEQHRQNLELGVAGLHQQYLADAAADPEQWEIWGKGERTPRTPAGPSRSTGRSASPSSPTP